MNKFRHAVVITPTGGACVALSFLFIWGGGVGVRFLSYLLPLLLLGHDGKKEKVIPCYIRGDVREREIM